MNALDESTANAKEVLDFWFGKTGEIRAEWFRKDAAFDAEIARRFAGLVERALAGELDHWQDEAATALARIVLLDQFTRNLHRGSPLAFAGDARALAGARALVDAGKDRALPPVQRAFVYLPFEHAEDPAAQDDGVRLFAALAEECADVADMADYARRHREVIARFGRFPHRNEALGRASTPAEIEFLRQPGSRF